jgi:hypothetical protein
VTFVQVAVHDIGLCGRWRRLGEPLEFGNEPAGVVDKCRGFERRESFAAIGKRFA